MMRIPVLVVSVLVAGGLVSNDECTGDLDTGAEEELQESRSMLSRRSRKSLRSELAKGERHKQVLKQHGAHQSRTSKDVYTRGNRTQPWIVCLPEGCDNNVTHKLVSDCVPSGTVVEFEGRPDANGLCCIGLAGSEPEIRKELDECQSVLPGDIIVEQERHLTTEEGVLEAPMGQHTWRLDREDDRSGENNDERSGSAIAALFVPQESIHSEKVSAATEETDPCLGHHGRLRCVLKRLGNSVSKGKGIDLQTKQGILWLFCLNLAVCLVGVCMCCSMASTRDAQSRQTVTLHSRSSVKGECSCHS